MCEGFFPSLPGECIWARFLVYVFRSIVVILSLDPRRVCASVCAERNSILMHLNGFEQRLVDLITSLWLWLRLRFRFRSTAFHLLYGFSVAGL